jgi:CheY-like chemotaxis protein
VSLSTIATFLLSAACLLLAFLRYRDTSQQRRADAVVVALVAAAFILHIVPLERITAFKGGGVEVTLEQPQVKAAISGLTADRIKNEELRGELESLADELDVVRGSRVLWIDNSPSVIVGARRLLRALGIYIVPVTSSEMAEETLMHDKDFDLIITDTQRPGTSYKINDGVPIHEGVNFIVKLRRSPATVVTRIPVIFFSAYDWDRLAEFTRPARETQPEPEISNAVNDLIVKIVRRLAVERGKPILYEDEKIPTRVEGDV